MAVTNYDEVPDSINTDATFRTWINNFHAALVAAGCVTQTADTGQIDTTTVTHPTAVNTFMGYSIWRFNDALQATAPVFIRFDFGSSGSSANSWGMKITVGSSTNGAGTIGGVTTGVMQPTITSSADATLRTSYVSGAPGQLTMSLFRAGTYPFFFSLERARTTAGASSGEAYTVTINGAQTAFKWVPFNGGTIVTATTAPILMPQGLTTGVEGANVAVYPTFPVPQGPIRPALRGYLCYFNGDIAALSGDQAVPIYGSSDTYRPMGRQFNTGALVSGVASPGPGVLQYWQ